MFQFRRFPSYTYGFSAWYMSFTHVDCSIRKSMDRCPLTAPHSLSQLVASFFGSQCQGIPLALFVAWPCVLLGSFKTRLLQRLALWNCRFRFKILVFQILSYFLALSAFSLFSFQCTLELTNQFTKFGYRQTFCTGFPAASFAKQNLAEVHNVNLGGLKWTRTTDLTLIRRVL